MRRTQVIMEYRHRIYGGYIKQKTEHQASCPPISLLENTLLQPADALQGHEIIYV